MGTIDEEQYKWLVIQGCPRSGTGMLTTLLNSNEELGVTLEKNLNIFGRDEKDLVEKYKNIFANKQEKISYFGDKLPSYFFYNRKLKEKIKDFKIIHISRNPLHAIASMKEQNYYSKIKSSLRDKNWNRLISIKDACALWITAWNEINKLKNGGNNAIHIKYEDLTNNPKREAEKIATFLGVNNNFNLSIILKDKRRPNFTKDELKIMNKHLRDIISSWDSDLEEIEEKFPKLNNLYFPTLRIIAKSYMWDILKFLKS